MVNVEKLEIYKSSLQIDHAVIESQKLTIQSLQASVERLEEDNSSLRAANENLRGQVPPPLPPPHRSHPLLTQYAFADVRCHGSE